MHRSDYASQTALQTDAARQLLLFIHLELSLYHCLQPLCTKLPPRVKAMGDKTTARRLAEECGVPTVPGSKDPITDAQSALKFAKSAGFPVILKAAMGGGGRGMRVVHQGKAHAWGR